MLIEVEGRRHLWEHKDRGDMDSGEEMLEEEGKAGKKKPHRVKVQ